MVKYSLADALKSHTIPAVKRAIAGYGIIGENKYGEPGKEKKDKEVIEHALTLVAEFHKYSIQWWNDNSDNLTYESGWVTDILDGDYYGEYHTMGWEEEPDFIDTNPTLAVTETNRYRKQLIIIAALCEKHERIDFAAPGSAAKIKNLVEEIGQKIDEETVHSYLKLLPQALGNKTEKE